MKQSSGSSRRYDECIGRVNICYLFVVSMKESYCQENETALIVGLTVLCAV